MNISALLAGLFSGILGAMGLGGGSVLIIYLSLFTQGPHLKNQGINLLFFIPIALISVIIYGVKKKIKWKTTLKVSAFGMVGTLVGWFTAGGLGGEVTSKIFGVLLLALGLNQIFGKWENMLFFKKKNRNKNVLSQMDGREIKYVTKRTKNVDSTVREEILGKTGRIVVLNDEIRVMCGETDVFRANIDDTEHYLLMSGDGITVSGVNKINGEKMDIVVYYLYHRK
ncbi:MAG: sulfite exporter TauE/SafE family protein [Clostridia bacterium]|nr:sulfite exporter TauE/SafE family protein [Clostridia bacterium]